MEAAAALVATMVDTVDQGSAAHADTKAGQPSTLLISSSQGTAFALVGLACGGQEVRLALIRAASSNSIERHGPRDDFGWAVDSVAAKWRSPHVRR